MGDEKNSWWDGSSTTKKWKDFGILYIKNMYIYTVYILYYIYVYLYRPWCCKINSCERELLKDLLQQVHAVTSSIHNSGARLRR